jgi:hypothetical protein
VSYRLFLESYTVHHPGVANAQPGVVEDHPRVLKDHSVVIEDHPGVEEAHRGIVDDHPGPWNRKRSYYSLTVCITLES